VYDDLTLGNPILRVLEHFCGVAHHRIPLDGSEFAVDGVPGLRFSALPLASKAAPYSPHREASVPGDNIGLTIIDAANGRRVFYAPGLGERNGDVEAAMRAADCVLVDGTFWTDDEMIALGFSRKTGRSIGHLPQSGPGGMLEWLDTLPARTRKVLVHINNTNPILDDDGPERALLERHGVEVAHDGLEIAL
jgi:pyrroloquinoline quinone biosynthesis protein B